MVVAVTWLDGGTAVFKANSIRQVKGGNCISTLTQEQ